ncbi:MAG: DUF4360 domain-containing protein, partial [Proteobacteria bacterium]
MSVCSRSAPFAAIGFSNLRSPRASAPSFFIPHKHVHPKVPIFVWHTVCISPCIKGNCSHSLTAGKADAMTFTKVFLPALTALTAQFYLSSPASAQAKIPLEQVYIKNFTASGSGCTAGSFEKNLSDDKRAFTMTYSRFVAEIAPWIAPSEARKNCSITLTLNIPAGFQYTVGTFNYRGFMDLAPQVKADFKTIYFFEGVGETGNFTKTEFGPLEKDFVYTDTVGVTSAYLPETWSPCSTERALIINPTISLTRLDGAAADVQSV